MLESKQESGTLEDELSDAQLFQVEIVPNQYMGILYFLMVGKYPYNYTVAQRWKLVTRSAYYHLIVGKLY